MKKKSIKPLGENILITPQISDKKTNSGIYLPDSASQEKPQQGKVVAVGDDKKIKVRKNQQVIYNRYGGTEIEMEGNGYLIVKNEDVLAIIE
jgi:chaperonin GroES